jgi:hypothetical protein
MGFKKSSQRPSKEAERYEGQRWEYRARNLKKVAGMAMEGDFNEHGAAGWEFCAVADDYAIFKRPVSERESLPSFHGDMDA